MNNDMIGARIVAGINPFFKFIFFANITVVIVAAMFSFKISIWHVLIYPSILAVLYAEFRTRRKLNRQSPKS